MVRRLLLDRSASRRSRSSSTTLPISATTSRFVLAAIALIPLAWLIGEATEHAASTPGPGIGGFLNATFGNAPELIIALFAVARRADRGRARLADGLRRRQPPARARLLAGRRRPRRDRPRSTSSRSRSIGFATRPLPDPVAIPGWHGDPERHSLDVLSLPVSIVLLLIYVAVTTDSLRRHRACTSSSDDEHRGLVVAALARRARVATVATALVAEILVGSIETFAEKVGLSRLLRRCGDRRDRRQRRRARRRRHRRRPRQDQARGRDRARVERPGRRLPDPRRRAALLADRPARALFRQVELAALAGAPSSRPRSCGAAVDARPRGLARRRLRACRRRSTSPATVRPAKVLDCPSDRIGREVEPHRRAVLVAHDAQDLAELASLGHAPAVLAVRLEPGDVATGRTADEPCLEAPASTRRRAPSPRSTRSEQRLELGRRARVRRARGPARRQARRASEARSSASPTAARCDGGRQHGRADPLRRRPGSPRNPGIAPPCPAKTRSRSGRGRAPGPRPLPPLRVDHRPYAAISSSVDRAARSSPAARNEPSGEIAGRAPELAERSGRLDALDVLLRADAVGVRLDE